MLPTKIRSILQEGEGLRIEFKECRTALNKNVYETVCAFLNRHGGELLLGVNDNGTVTGIDPEDFTPYPKNPVIAGVFKQMGMADELGSGIRNLVKYVWIYSKAVPQLFDQDVFKIVIPLPAAGDGKDTEQVTVGVNEQDTAQDTAQVGMFCREPRAAKEIMQLLGLKHWKTFQENYLNPLLDDDFIERTIPDRPNSRLQKYRLTDKGRQIMNGASDA